MQETKKKFKISKLIVNIIFILVVIICGSLIYFNFTHTYYIVKGPSMAPTLNLGVIGAEETLDGVFVSKVKKYKRGDIIIINKNYGDMELEESDVIKRLIAIENDKITVRLIDDVYRIVLIKSGTTEEVILEESYLQNYDENKYLYEKFELMVKTCGYVRDENGFITITENNIFYLGDNRKVSRDSSEYGFKSKDAVVGKVDYIIYGNKNLYGQVIKQFFGW